MFNKTVLDDGLPFWSTVAIFIALGSSTPDFNDCSNQTLNCTKGFLSTSLMSRLNLPYSFLKFEMLSFKISDRFVNAGSGTKYYLSLESPAFILLTASISKSFEVAYENLMQSGDPKASPETIATCTVFRRYIARSSAVFIT